METRRRSSSTIPFGWDLHPLNENLLIKDETIYETIDYVKSLTGVPINSIPRIIKARTGKHISTSGVKKLLKRGY